MVTNLPAELLNIEPLDLLAGLGEEDQLWGFPRDLLEHCALELRLEVPVDEVLHLGELQRKSGRSICALGLITNLVQSSSGAGLDDRPVDGVVLKLDSILALNFVFTPDHCSKEEQAAYQPPHDFHF